MIYTAGELKLSLGGFAQINNAVKKGKYHKISHGLYTDESPFLSEPENIFARYPNAILTLESAFEYYDMFDYIPDFYVVVTPLKSHRIRNQKSTPVLYVKKHYKYWQNNYKNRIWLYQHL